MHLGFQPDAAHADGLLHVLAVDHKFLGLHQQQPLIGGNVDGLGGFNHAGNVGGRDLAVLDGHHAAGIDAADVAACDAGGHACNAAIGHQLGLLQRLLNALHRGVDVDHHPAFQAVAGGDAQARELELPVGGDFGHHHHDLRRSDVETNHQIFVFLGHDVLLVCTRVMGYRVGDADGRFAAAVA